MDANILNGTIFIYDFSFSQYDVIMFAKATGDDNPIHLDEEFASKSIFKRKIIHGFLAGSVFSKIFGTLFPGNGTVYLKQSMTFKKPMFVDENYKAKIEILEIYKDRNRALVKTEIYDTDEQIALTGEALIQLP